MKNIKRKQQKETAHCKHITANNITATTKPAVIDF